MPCQRHDRVIGFHGEKGTYARKRNSKRVAGPYVDLNIGLVEINWEAGESPSIYLKTIRLDGSIALQHAISLGDLQFAAGTGPAASRAAP